MKAPRILQFGTIGQLGLELIAAARLAGIPLQAVSQEQADFTRPDDVVRIVRETDCDIVVNAAAYTAVDKAESEELLAQTINADTVGVLAEACIARGLPLIHISTDYVFDGSKPTPYIETDATCPLNAYGRSKLNGEIAVQAAGKKHVILRTSWVYSAQGANFVKTILRLGAEREILNVVDDQHGAPTSAKNLAQTVLSVAQRIAEGVPDGGFGLFHYSGAGETTWCDFARAILEGAQTWAPVKAKVFPIPTRDYPTPAQRPLNSRLSCGKIEKVYGIKPVPWRIALREVLDELHNDANKT